jgi:ribosome biogenesis GTPase
LKHVPVLSVSAKTGTGFTKLQEYIKKGETCAFIGSSGVGKTTIINRLMGEERLKTTGVREKDANGRHTTARRELLLLPDGGLVIDTPGMRELGLWDSNEGLQDTYSDIRALAEQCHFSDCSHSHEIKCAIRNAVESGEIATERYQNFLKLQQELIELDEKRLQQALAEKKRKDKIMHRAAKAFFKNHYKNKK